MLNRSLIVERLTALGWSQSQLADQCGVSREAVSNWLSGESLPRPRKLRQIGEALDLPLNVLLHAEAAVPEPVVAYRTKRNAPVSEEALEIGVDAGRHLRELLPYLQRDDLFTPGVLEAPQLDDAYIRRAARQTRMRSGLTLTEPISHAHLLSMHRNFGSILVPVLWGEDKVGHENALSIYLPESKASWVVFNLNARLDDFNYWMAHELAHCYTLNVLRGEEGERFAERFAQTLLFPEDVALAAYHDLVGADVPMRRVEVHAKAHHVSAVMALTQIDRISHSLTGKSTGLRNDECLGALDAARSEHPTVARAFFGCDVLTSSQYIEASERIFETPIFRALDAWQLAQGGISAAFIATALNIHLGDAAAIGTALVARRSAIVASAVVR